MYSSTERLPAHGKVLSFSGSYLASRAKKYCRLFNGKEFDVSMELNVNLNGSPPTANRCCSYLLFNFVRFLKWT